MKAICIHSYGHSNQLRLQETDVPKLKSNEVLVRVHDAGVNHIDWKIREGFFQDETPAQFPLVMGQDFAGEVQEVGENVTLFKKGDRVLGIARGTYAEYVAVPDDSIALLPEGLDYVTAASVPTAGLTAYQIVMNVLSLTKGQTVLVHGAGGGVGLFATQLAIWQGARLIANASHDDKAFLQELGVSRFIDYKAEKFDELVRDVDVVIDLVGGETLKRSFGVVKAGGVICTTVGPIDLELAKEAGIHAIDFAMKPDAEDLHAVARLVADGILSVLIKKIVPLRRARRAQLELERGETRGKIVVQVTAP